jgi:hypothetical protein
MKPVKTNRRTYGQFSTSTGNLIPGRRRNRRIHDAAAPVTGGIPCRPAPIVSDLANRDRSYVARRCDRCGRGDGHRLRRCCRSCCTYHNRPRHESGRRRPAVPIRIGTVVTVVVVLHVGNCRSTRVLHFLCAGLAVTLVLLCTASASQLNGDSTTTHATRNAGPSGNRRQALFGR